MIIVQQGLTAGDRIVSEVKNPNVYSNDRRIVEWEPFDRQQLEETIIRTVREGLQHWDSSRFIGLHSSNDFRPVAQEARSAFENTIDQRVQIIELQEKVKKLETIIRNAGLENLGSRTSVAEERKIAV